MLATPKLTRTIINQAQSILERVILNTEHAQSLKLLGDVLYFWPKRDEPEFERAAMLYQRAARAGEHSALTMIGVLYANGLGLPRDTSKALLYYTFGAQHEDMAAQVALGTRHMFGIGVEKSCLTARSSYMKAAKRVADQFAAHKLPTMSKLTRISDETDQSYEPHSQYDIIEYLMYSADPTEPTTQMRLGLVFYHGATGVDVDYNEARQYFKMAADKGSGSACGYLGNMYWRGEGVEQNNRTAYEYFKAGTALNSPLALNGMGLMYLHGIEVAKNPTEALRYFERAANEGGLGEAHYNAAMALQELQPVTALVSVLQHLMNAVREGYLLAFYELAKIQSAPSSTCNLSLVFFKSVAEKGEMLRIGREAYLDYNDGNLEAALAKYIYLAEMGYETAQANAAYIFEHCTILRANPGPTLLVKDEGYKRRALVFWERASKQFNAHAHLRTGDFYYYGYGLPKPLPRLAVSYYYETPEATAAQGAFNLAYMLHHGIGLPKDLELARRLYKSCSESSGEAYIPASLALFKLWVDQALAKLRNPTRLKPKINWWKVCGGTMIALAFGAWLHDKIKNPVVEEAQSAGQEEVEEANETASPSEPSDRGPEDEIQIAEEE